MKVEFLAPARRELAQAVRYYNDVRDGLGFEFSREVRNAVKRIVRHPVAWPMVSKRARRHCTNRFPYGVIYEVRGDLVLVIAVMHLRRAPESWRTRI